MMLSSRSLSILLALTCAVAGVGVVPGAETDPDEKAWKEDEKRDAADPEHAESQRTLKGKIELVEPDPKKPVEKQNLGSFRLTDGRAYILRAANTDVYNMLKGYNGQTVNLSGKVRVNDKYFVAEMLSNPPTPPVARKKRGGS